ncbi:MAG: hypothetical protein PHI63_00870 [Patescibacteria group bacterium]|nr:hypothetical protein [Patescibacteria group bacterium]
MVHSEGDGCARQCSEPDCDSLADNPSGFLAFLYLLILVIPAVIIVALVTGGVWLFWGSTPALIAGGVTLVVAAGVVWWFAH